MPFSPGSLRTEPKARRAARDFADLLGEVINATVSRAPIAFVEVDDAPEFRGFIAHAPNRVPKPLPLENGHFLYLVHRVCLRRKERYLTTLEYRYVYQADANNPDSWIVRYEYEREPQAPYRYPVTHIHVNATPSAYSGQKPFPDLHLPTGRLTVEDLIRHLVHEQQIAPISPDWEAILERTEQDFREIQRKRFAD